MKFQKRRVYFQDTRLSKNIILQKYKKSDGYTPVDNILDGKVFFLFFFFFLLLINIAEILFMVSMFVHRCLKSKIVIALSLSIELPSLANRIV